MTGWTTPQHRRPFKSLRPWELLQMENCVTVNAREVREPLTAWPLRARWGAGLCGLGGSARCGPYAQGTNGLAWTQNTLGTGQHVSGCNHVLIGRAQDAPGMSLEA